MVGKLLNVRIPNELNAQIIKQSKEDGFGTTQELVRELLRRYAADKKTEHLMQAMRSLYGSQKNSARLLSKDELDALLLKSIK